MSRCRKELYAISEEEEREKPFKVNVRCALRAKAFKERRTKSEILQEGLRRVLELED